MFTRTDVASTGNVGDLMITTSQLLLEGGGQISTSTFGEGNGGNLTINAEFIEVTGESLDGQVGSGLAVQTALGSGNAGNLNITTYSR